MPHFDSQLTFCYTDNLQRTSEWYQKVLGLELAIDQGKCHILRVTPQSFLGICERDAVSIHHENVILTFVTDDVDAWYDRLLRYKAIVVDEPKENPAYNIYHFFARDPNGYRIEIQRFLLPSAREVCHKSAL